MNKTYKEDQKLFFRTDYHYMHVKSLQEEHSAVLSTCIKIPNGFPLRQVKQYIFSISQSFPFRVVGRPSGPQIILENTSATTQMTTNSCAITVAENSKKGAA